MTLKVKILPFLIILTVFIYNKSYAENHTPDFDKWLLSFKEESITKGISRKTLDEVFKNVSYLPKVIKYDRKQPEFYEDTLTYVGKRANKSRTLIAKTLLNKHKVLLNKIEKEFNVEKEVLLALWGIETNFGKYVGKMDIISSLATLSYDKRRRDFFSEQLFILIKLIDDKKVNQNTLFGSWAGAFGNFQFMPSTIKNYAIDYDGNKKIELKKSLDDSFASAANYISSIGWNKNASCFIRVKLTRDIKEKYINYSARGISNRLKISKWKKLGLTKFDGTELDEDLKAALIIPDGKLDTPSYLVFGNYEKILKWNRSLRFGISICTLGNMIKK
jgi:membrane-bound lytic murein transglycosylase B